MAFTRQASEEILKHLVTMLDTSKDERFARTFKLNGVSDLVDLSSLSKEDIEFFEIPPLLGETPARNTPLPRGHKNKLCLMVRWLHQLRIQNDGLPLTEGEYLFLTKEEFDEFRITIDNVNTPSPGQSNPTAQKTSNDPSDFGLKKDIDNFKRGIKRDAALYPSFRDEQHWDSWNRSVHAQARSHDVAEILDPTYKPKGDLEKELFEQKQSFMYSVFNRVLQTDIGKTLVRKYEHTYNAQQVYADLLDHATKSTAATLSVEKLIDYLVNARLDSRWNGSTVGFILHWRDKMRMFEELASSSEHYSEGVKKRMLSTSVNGIPELRQVKTQEEQLLAIGSKALTYDGYFTLLMSAATRRDSELKLPPQRSRRTVHKASTAYGFDEADFYDDGYVQDNFSNFGDSSNDASYQVHLSERIPYEIWQTLPQEAKDHFIRERKSEDVDKPRTQGLFKKPGKFKPAQRQVKVHQCEEIEELEEHSHMDDDPDTNDGNSVDNNIQLAVNRSEKVTDHPGDVKNVISSASKHNFLHMAKEANKAKAKENKDYVIVNGKKYFSAYMSLTTYISCHQNMSQRLGSLVDRGANGGIAGDDVLLLEKTQRTCDISGIDNHTMSNLPIATCAGLVYLDNNPIIVILHQYAYTGKGKSIHSSAQIESFGNTVDDRSFKVKGKQCIETVDGYTFPLYICNGLPYLKMAKPTPKEVQEYKHVILTSDSDWDPSILDDESKHGDKESVGINVDNHRLMNNAAESTIKEPDYDALRKHFCFMPASIVQKTFECTTQWARMVERYPFRKHFKARFPALNVARRNEPVATDTIYSDVPAIDNGRYRAQLFVGCHSFVTDVYILQTEAYFISALQDNVRERGAMEKLVSDRAQVEISQKVKDYLRQYHIKDWQSEPYHEHQNFAERRYQTVKQYVNKILDRTGAPPETWFLCMQYVCFILNRTYVEKLGHTPLQALTGQTPDISTIMPFYFWEPVYFATADALSYNNSVSFPSATAEGSGHFVGFADNVGDAMTYKVLTADTNKVIYRSSVRSATTTEVNQRTTPLIENIEPSLLPAEPGNVETVQELDFNTSLPNDIVDYNNVLDHIENTYDDDKDPNDKFWEFKEIASHEGPLTAKSAAYKGSSYNVLVVWGDGTKTWEPLKTIAADAPVTCALYARKNGLLKTPGWQRFQSVCRHEHLMNKRISVCKHSFKFKLPVHKFGYTVPRTAKEAIEFDKLNKNTNWKVAINTELDQLNEYETFKNLGRGVQPPEGYKRIRVHFVFDVKHDARHKARLVADGHLTDTPDDSTYSSVVSLRNLRLVVFIGEATGCDIWGADVGNAYLESYTKEKVFIIAGPEFGELEGCTLVVNKALYGLKSSGLRWHERFADTLRDLGFEPSKADPDVWMHLVDDHYEYIAVYVDDLAIISKNPKAITDTLVTKYKYKLKGVGPIKYHLGANFDRDDDGTLRYGPRKYIGKLIDSYKHMFGELPRERISPLSKNDHPELDDSPEVDEKTIKQYQSMIGALQWTITLGRFDIHAAVMTMSRFRIAPRIGHMDRLKRIYGYLRKFDNGDIRFRTGIPDFSTLKRVKYNWDYSVYQVDQDSAAVIDHPTVQVPVIISSYVDANLMHCMITGRSSTGILHLLNGTPIEWYSKRQATVETATYGSEFVAARTAVDQVVDLQYTLGQFGVSIVRTLMFGDNKSVVTSSTIPQSRLNKRHNALSYHRVREAIANNVLEFHHIDGRINPADMLSKFAGYQQFWPLLRTLLFWGVKDRNAFIKLQKDGSDGSDGDDHISESGE